ncbi:MAG: phosphatidate cytidylyltransferase [Methylophilaceae bacterium]|nr:phosphatidate cytidylyltransferase [Methylophilaceae bacterium]
MTLTRIISAFFLFLLFSISFFNSNSIYFQLLVILVCFFGILELQNMLFKKMSIIFLLSTILLMIMTLLNFPDPKLVAYISLSYWIFFVPLLIFGKLFFSNLNKYLLGTLLIFNIFYSTIYLYKFHQELLLFALFVVWIADSTAFFVGKKYGRNKLAPLISPGKTIEGAVGAIFFTTLFALVFSDIFDLDYGVSIFYAFVITLFSILGDLLESFLKRHANLKDSGNIIPGHGGVMDRIDGLCASIPIIFSFIIIFDL